MRAFHIIALLRAITSRHKPTWREGLLTRYAKLRVVHASGTFSPPPRVSDPDMQGLLTIGFLSNRWRWKRSRRMRYPQCCVSVWSMITPTQPLYLMYQLRIHNLIYMSCWYMPIFAIVIIVSLYESNWLTKPDTAYLIHDWRNARCKWCNWTTVAFTLICISINFLTWYDELTRYVHNGPISV